jgi:hypothetical protein
MACENVLYKVGSSGYMATFDDSLNLKEAEG